MDLEMPAAPEMDTLLATRLMGWRRYMLPVEEETWCWLPERCPSIDISPGVVNVIGGHSTWSPSMRLDDAMEVVAEMRKTSENWFSLNWYGDGPGWYCGFGNGRRSSLGEGETAPLAICRGALLALGVIGYVL